MNHHLMLNRVTAAGIAVMLLAAACTPSSDLNTPVGTESGLNTAVVSSPMPTVAVTTAATTVATTAATMAATTAATTAATAQGTALATQPATTGTPNANMEPAVVLSEELVGSTIVDTQGTDVGEVKDLLIDNTGAVQYVIFDAADYLAGNASDATPVATQTDSETDTGILAVPMTDFMVNANATADDKEHVLAYTGTADDLRSMGAFNSALFDQDSFVIDSTASDLAADMTYDGMIRASKLGNVDLKNEAGDALGDVKDLILDVNQGKVTYGVVDFGGLLGLGEQTTAVPWDMFTVQSTDAAPDFRLQTTADTLESAPTIDLGDWPDWPERVQSNSDWNPGWDNDLRAYWSSAASS